jgi:hypothetical protein
MKFHLILIIALLIINLGATQTTAEADNQALEDVVVKGTYQLGAEKEKLPVILKADFSNLVEIRERIHWSVVDWQLGGGQTTLNLFEQKMSVPQLVRIIPAPAKVFHLNFKDLSSWKIDIFTSDGRNFRSLSGEDDPPRTVAWDGRGDDGNPLLPGEPYAYSFTAIDRAGNRRTFPGEAFSIPCLYLQGEEGVWVGLANTCLFSSEGFGLLKTAEEYCSEIVNFIYYYSPNGNIKIQSGHPDTEKFLELLSQKLGRDMSIFQRLPVEVSGDNCFRMWVN